MCCLSGVEPRGVEHYTCASVTTSSEILQASTSLGETNSISKPEVIEVRIKIRHSLKVKDEE